MTIKTSSEPVSSQKVSLNRFVVNLRCVTVKSSFTTLNESAVVGTPEVLLSNFLHCNDLGPENQVM